MCNSVSEKCICVGTRGVLPCDAQWGTIVTQNTTETRMRISTASLFLELVPMRELPCAFQPIQFDYSRLIYRENQPSGTNSLIATQETPNMSQIIDSRYDIGPALKTLLARLFPGQPQLCQVSVSVTKLMRPPEVARHS